MAMSAIIELIVFLLYIGVGPIMWTIYGWGMFKGRARMMLIRTPRDPAPLDPPHVSILIPAKDEGERIRACLQSALEQDYPNFDVVAVNDRSADETGAVMDEMAAANPKLKIVHIPPGSLPDGWTGKNNALHNGVQQANGSWLLFVDSDVILQPDALSATLGMAHRKRFDLVSLIPRMEWHTFWEGMLVPLASSAIGAAHAMALTNAASSKIAFGNGQYMLIRREAYVAAGGHEAVRDKFCEDMVMAKRFKELGFKPRVAWGTDLIAVRMYDSLQKILRGWSRIFFAASDGRPWRTIFSLLFVVFCCYSAYPALAWGIYRLFVPGNSALTGFDWLVVSLLHLGVMTFQIGVMYRWQVTPWKYALLFPLGGLFLIYIFASALKMCMTRRVEWRGTSYSRNIAAAPRAGT
jgi:glycosyltransferase involved in cell wall biosynthesis